MTNWRPEHPSEPEPEWTHAYQALGEVAPALTVQLIDAYRRRWLDQAELPLAKLPEVGDTLELLVRPDDDGQVLRLTSWYTGSTYWLYEWDGAEASALAWITDVADLQAGNVQDDRVHGPTVWDND